MDKKDKQILKILEKNSRISYKKLGKKLDMTDVAAKNRVNKLIEKGIITEFTIGENPEKIGLPLQVTIGVQTDPKRQDEIAENLKKIKELYFIWKVTGAHNLHVHGAFKDHQHMNTVLEETMSMEGVRGYHLSVMSEELKHDKIYKNESNGEEE